MCYYNELKTQEKLLTSASPLHVSLQKHKKLVLSSNIVDVNPKKEKRTRGSLL